jgi:hypothetical protein
MTEMIPRRPFSWVEICEKQIKAGKRLGKKKGGRKEGKYAVQKMGFVENAYVREIIECERQGNIHKIYKTTDPLNFLRHSNNVCQAL